MDEQTLPADIEVFRGSRAACLEFGLVLDAKGLEYERAESDGTWVIRVAPAAAEVAGDELRRYASERTQRGEIRERFEPFSGSGVGAAAYAGLLMLVAYCAGNQILNRDWLSSGAIASRAGGGEWWRAVTALTLHLDQEHLLGNLLFGIAIGMLAGRMFGPGVAWLGILAAGAAANYIDMWVSPPWHRAVGASTAVFAGLGLLAGFGWGERSAFRDRRLYRWTPLFAGVCLLGLLGAGDQHVDVLGHLLGFVMGVGFGWAFSRLQIPRSRARAPQLLAGTAALLTVGASWLLALRHGS